MEEKVLRFIRDNGLIDPGDDVTVALSGGADSVALLRILRALAPQLGISLRAAHFHHGLRGAEADRDAEFCRKLCADWAVPFSLGGGDVTARAAETGESLEEAARVLRYAYLQSVSPGKLATAHNADDNAETMLLHLLRGTGLRGLGGIPVRRGAVIRPLLACTRAEIEALLEREGLPHVEDGTNAADDCVRNRLRHRVLPLLRAENPNLSRTLGRTAALLREEDGFLSRLAARAAADCRREGGWSCEALLALEPVLRRRVLLAMLTELGLEDPAQVYVEALERLLTAAPSAKAALPGGWIARRTYDLLGFSGAETAPALPELALQVPGCTALPDGLGTISCRVTKNLKNFKKNLTTFAIKCDMIATLELYVRGRRPGDRLTLPGGTKPLKALMIDRKIPARQRNAVPVLTAAGKPVAVFGVGCDPTWMAKEGEAAVVVEYSGGRTMCAPTEP
jgi:tRNA(Ile)-lysidine synthase